MTKVYKFEVMVIDHEGMDEDDVIFHIEDVSYINASVMSSAVREIEWNDDHPLNKSGYAQEFRRMFG